MITENTVLEVVVQMLCVANGDDSGAVMRNAGSFSRPCTFDIGALTMLGNVGEDTSAREDCNGLVFGAGVIRLEVRLVSSTIVQGISPSLRVQSVQLGFE